VGLTPDGDELMAMAINVSMMTVGRQTGVRADALSDISFFAGSVNATEDDLIQILKDARVVDPAIGNVFRP
jgi:hypothetical protein